MKNISLVILAFLIISSCKKKSEDAPDPQETVSFAYAASGTLGDIQIGTAHLGIGNYLTSTGTPCQAITALMERLITFDL
jgi:hypothetical protein